MKEELSRKEVTREIWNGFDVCLKYRVELGSKVWKNVSKTHILGIFGGHVPVHLEHVSVHPSRTEHVPVHVKRVPIHPVLFFLFRLVFVF